jgi:tyrosyl-tRNA synthetase/tRNA-binding EMAP/Myf-like protein
MKLTENKVKDLISKIEIVKVLKIEKHSNADKLLVIQILTKNGEKQIVTGADNFKEGDLVPYLAPGFTVPGFLFFKGETIVLEKRPLRGVDSEGMILAEDEIGLGEDHSGIYVVELSAVGGQHSEGDLVGKSLLEILSNDQLEKVLDNAKAIRMTPELQKRIDIIKSIAEEGGEIVGEDELPEILTSGEELFTYDGFEPSGQMHIAQGIIRAINTNKMIEAGFTFRMWVADWFGYLNNKMGGDMEKIQKVGKYFIEIWKAAGMNLEHTEFLWTSDFVGQREYWETVMKVSKATTLKRMLKTTEIMGRSEADDLTAAQMLYPAMQVTDIFKVMKCQVTELGLDQRKVNMLAREIGPELGFWKPVVVSHGMLQGLQTPVANYINDSAPYSKGETVKFGVKRPLQLKLDQINHDDQSIKIIVKDLTNNKEETEVIKFGSTKTVLNSKFTAVIKPNAPNVFDITIKHLDDDIDEVRVSTKMSKSKPDTAIFMTDTAEDVRRKIINAYCPPNEVEDNPVLKYVKQIIFQAHFLKGFEDLLKDGFKVEREEKWGGNVVYQTYEELEQDYAIDKLSPPDLKEAVIKYLNILLTPVRDHFINNADAKKLLEEVKSFQVTR